MTVSPDVVAAWVNSPEFLQSYDWRRVRMEILKERGARCDACGATRADGVVMNVDHIRPRRTHPELALDKANLQVLCGPCNHGKGSWDETDWRDTEGPEDHRASRLHIERLQRVARVARAVSPLVADGTLPDPPSWWWNLGQDDIDLAAGILGRAPEILRAVASSVDSAEMFRDALYDWAALEMEKALALEKLKAETIARANP